MPKKKSPKSNPITDEAGIEAIIFLQSLAGYKETKASAAKGWASLSDHQKEHTITAYTLMKAHQEKNKTGRTPPGIKPSQVTTITPELLGRILFEEFDRDHWGDIDPDYFRQPYPEDEDDEHGSGAAMLEVLTRVAQRLNNLQMEPPAGDKS